MKHHIRRGNKPQESVSEPVVFDGSRRHNYQPMGNVGETVQAQYGTGGGNTPLVLERNAKCLNGDEVANTLVSSLGNASTGTTQDKNVIVTETYQKTTGALLASGYDKLGTQEAMNDMYVVQKSVNAQSMEVYHCTSEDEKVSTLKARDYKDPQIVAYSTQACGDRDNSSQSVMEEKAYTIPSNPMSDRGQAVVCGVDFHNSAETGEVSKTLNSAASDSDHVPCVYGLDRASYNQGKNAKIGFCVEEEKIGPQTAMGPGAVCTPQTYQDTTGTLCSAISRGTSNQIATDDQLVTSNSIVRRLTPKECERLQGFPDDWTLLPDGWTDSKGKFHKPDIDSNRYKALGNSICLPYWQYLADKLIKVLKKDTDEEPTMCSLFDGIGGFPLVFSRVGCRPIWASEIEEFPIAVTKVRFPEEK